MKAEDTYSLDERVRLIAQDIYDQWKLTSEPAFHDYSPSVSVRGIIDEQEYRKIISFLHTRGCISKPNWTTLFMTDIELPTCSFILYEQTLHSLLQSKKPSEIASYSFDKVGSYLHIKDKAILLARRPGQISLQYWIVSECLKKPDKAVEETKILGRHKPDYDIDAPKRTIRDAANKLNKKIYQACGIKDLFLYGSGRVTFQSKLIRT